MGSKKQGGGGTREPVEDSSNNVTRWSCSTITISTTHRSSKRQRQHHSATRANNTIQSKDSFRFQGKDKTRFNTLFNVEMEYVHNQKNGMNQVNFTGIAAMMNCERQTVMSHF